MKYYRTDVEKYIFNENELNHIKKDLYETKYNVPIKVIKEADDIFELCDVIIIVYKDSPPIIYPRSPKLFMLRKEYFDFDATCYAAIWVKQSDDSLELIPIVKIDLDGNIKVLK